MFGRNMENIKRPKPNFQQKKNLNLRWNKVGRIKSIFDIAEKKMNKVKAI